MRQIKLYLSLLLAVAVLPVGGCTKDDGGDSKPAGKVDKTAGAGAGAALANASPADIEAGKKTFETTCAACHTIGGGDRIGPDLHGLWDRRDHAWVVKWMKDPMGMAKSDPIGRELLAKFNNVPMPPTNLDDAQLRKVLAYVADAGSKAQPAGARAPETPAAISEEEFAHAKQVYFNRCAGCHGTLRAGATGPKIDESRSLELGREGLRTILTHGTPGGMPAWGTTEILTDNEIDLLARFLQHPPPEPPQRPIEQIRESWNLMVPVAKRPKKPLTKRNWKNYFGIVLRDAGKVAIIDGDTKELVEIVDTGFAVHILRSSSTGRYFYAVGRDGKVTLIDLWTEKPSMVAQVQGCYDARSIDGSKFKGYEDKLVVEGCYWPPQYVVMDGQTLEPKKVHSVLTSTYDTDEKLDEVRVAAIVASHDAPVWVANFKESGYVGVIDYSKPDFPIVDRIPAERFLHDGGWDHSGRYYMVAANMRNQMVIIDVKEKKFVAKFETGNKPHPGRGANWIDPVYGWVNGTTHMGEGKLAVYGADPKGSPEHAWKVVREIPLPAAGGLFLKTHPKSDWVWMDSTLANEADKTREICVYSKKDGKLEKCWQAADHGRVCHFEYNADGSEVWVSVWDTKGEVLVYDDKTLELKHRIQGDWMVTPTGKFNVTNTANDVY